MYSRQRTFALYLFVIAAVLGGLLWPAQTTARSPQAAQNATPQLFFPVTHKAFVDPQDPSRTWNGVFSLQNGSLTSPANVQVTFYTENGQAITPNQLIGPTGNPLSNPLTIPGGRGLRLDMATQNSLQPGRYSIAVSSDQPLSGVNWTTITGSGGAPSNGMYTAFLPDTSTTVFLPAVKKAASGLGGNLAILNLSGSPATNVAVKFYNQTGQQVQQRDIAQIAGYTSFHLNLQQFFQLNPGFDGSVVVSASAPVAVVNNQWGGSNDGSLLTSSSWSNGATTLYAPFLGRNSQALGATLTVQNTSANQPAAVTISHSDNSAPDQLQIPPLGSQTVSYSPQAAFAATITSNQPVAAVVTNLHASGSGSGSSYDAITQGATLYNIPLFARQYTSGNSSFNSELLIYNPGPESFQLKVWSALNGSQTDQTPPIPANSFATLASLNLPTDFLNPIFLTQTDPPFAKGTQPFFVMVSTPGQGQQSGDYLSAYRGVSLPEPSATMKKTVSEVYLQGGDTVTYTLSFSAGAEGGNATITDDLPDQLTDYTYEASAGLVLTQTAGADFVWDAYVPASGGVITITGVVTNAVDVGLPNTASIAIASGTAADTVTSVLDVNPPRTEITAQPPALDNNPTPSFSFTGDDSNAQGSGSGVIAFECQVDGGDFAPCTTPFTTESLADGEHTFAVRAIDRSGYVDPTPASYTWTIDTTPPAVPSLISPDNGTIIGTDIVTLTWQAGETSSRAVTNGDPAGYRLTLNGSISDVGNVTQTVVGPLANGVYTWTVAAYDGAGNASANASSRTFTVDKRLVIDPEQTSSATLGGSDGFTSTITVPAGAIPLTGTLEMSYAILPVEDLPAPPDGGLLLGFSLDLLQDGAVQSGVVFSKPITISIAYDSALVSDPSTLQLFYLDSNGDWSSDGITIITPIGNPLVATLTHLTDFGLAEVITTRTIYLPTVNR